MNVAFDEQIFTRQKFGGISRYFGSLMSSLASQPVLDVDVLTGWKWSINPEAVDAGLGRRWPETLDRLPTPRGMRPLLRAANMPTAVATFRRADIVHETYYVPTFRRHARSTPRAVTVVDMIPEVMPELFPRGNPHLSKEELVRSADLVFCISEATKVDMERVYGSVKAPIVITPLGTSEAFKPSARPPAYLPRNFVLNVGGRDRYKDFVTLLAAFSLIESANDDLAILAVGGGPITDDESARISTLGLAGRVHQMNVAETDLPGIYAAARCLAFPSVYEGFGLPTVEAMATGCPVIAADIPSHREVGGDAAEYFEPGNADALAAVLKQVLTDDAAAERMRESGLTRAEIFTWDACAKATAAGYRLVV